MDLHVIWIFAVQSFLFFWFRCISNASTSSLPSPYLIDTQLELFIKTFIKSTCKTVSYRIKVKDKVYDKVTDSREIWLIDCLFIMPTLMYLHFLV